MQLFGISDVKEIRIIIFCKGAGKMSEAKFAQATLPESRWKDLYRVGFISSVAMIVTTVLAVAAFFVWPYTPGMETAADIFNVLQNDRLGGLIALDLWAPIIVAVTIPQVLALYAAIKRVNESYALIALILGIMGSILWLTSRPLVEVVYLSEQYAAATTDAAKSHYLAAGEALLAFFNGTAWTIATLFIGFASFINSFIILRSRFMNHVIAYIGIGSALISFGVFIPGIGAFLSLLATVAGVLWSILLARTFYRLGWDEHYLA
jgi:hypothetical protein